MTALLEMHKDGGSSPGRWWLLYRGDGGDSKMVRCDGGFGCGAKPPPLSKLLPVVRCWLAAGEGYRSWRVVSARSWLPDELQARPDEGSARGASGGPLRGSWARRRLRTWPAEACGD
ncbi:hypothetical protein Droror1_Dr00026104 [Drosera rotundifolia]